MTRRDRVLHLEQRITDTYEECTRRVEELQKQVTNEKILIGLEEGKFKEAGELFALAWGINQECRIKLEEVEILDLLKAQVINKKEVA
jgi:hypothetical protein